MNAARPIAGSRPAATRSMPPPTETPKAPTFRSRVAGRSRARANAASICFVALVSKRPAFRNGNSGIITRYPARERHAEASEQRLVVAARRGSRHDQDRRMLVAPRRGPVRDAHGDIREAVVRLEDLRLR